MAAGEFLFVTKGFSVVARVLLVVARELLL